MDERQKLKQELKRLDAIIKDAEGRMPAHSAKPMMMQRIFELEEEREGIANKLNSMAAQQ